MEVYIFADKEIFKVISFDGSYINVLDGTDRCQRIPLTRIERFCDKEGKYLIYNIINEQHENVIMKFKDAPIGARFHFIGKDVPKDVWIKIHDYDNGLIVKWDGNVEGHQSHCSWLDKENGYDFDTNIKVL